MMAGSPLFSPEKEKADSEYTHELVVALIKKLEEDLRLLKYVEQRLVPGFSQNTVTCIHYKEKE